MSTSPQRTTARVLLPPALFFLVVIAIWQFATRLFALPAFVLPSPIAVAREIALHASTLAKASMLTAGAACAGFCMSLVGGCLTAFVFSQSAWVRRSSYPDAIFLQTVPIVAIAPLLIIWFGTGFQ